MYNKFRQTFDLEGKYILSLAIKQNTFVKLLPKHIKAGIYPKFLDALKQQPRLDLSKCIDLTNQIFINLANYSHAEIKVLMYVWQRTIGFQKEYEVIKYKHFLDGFKAKELRMDVGCMGSGTHLKKTIDSLVKRKILLRQLVGRHVYAFKINFEQIEQVNLKYASRLIRPERDKRVNEKTAFRLLRSFLSKHLKDVTGIELKVWLYSFAASQFTGKFSKWLQRKDYLTGLGEYGSIDNVYFILGLDIAKNSLYRALESLDNRRLLEFRVGLNNKICNVLCNPDDIYIKGAKEFKQIREEESNYKCINYASWRARRRIATKLKKQKKVLKSFSKPRDSVYRIIEDIKR